MRLSTAKLTVGHVGHVRPLISSKKRTCPVLEAFSSAISRCVISVFESTDICENEIDINVRNSNLFITIKVVYVINKNQSQLKNTVQTPIRYPEIGTINFEL